MRRRSSSAASTMRTREAATSASRARSAASWRRRSISAPARAAKIASAARSSASGSRRRARLHADVAQALAVAAAHGHGQIAVEAIADREAVVGEARARPLGDAHDLALEDELARRVLDRELEALAQLGAVVRDGEHACAVVALAEQLRHEGDLGVEGLRELLRELAEERATRRRRGRLSHRTQQVAAVARVGWIA